MKQVLAFFFWVAWMTVFNTITFTSAAIVLCVSQFMTKKHGLYLRNTVKIWARVGFITAFSPVIVRGKENLVNEPAVIVANHQSNLDILILAGYLPLDFLFFSKKEVFYIPLVGQLMKKMGYVSVDRKNPKRAASSIRHAIERIKTNNRVLIFPEGTRSPNPKELLPFKPGSLMVARMGRVPILPVIIYGTSRILPINKSFYMMPNTSVISVLKPILLDDPLHPANAKSIEEEDQLLDKLHDKMNMVYKTLADELEEKNKSAWALLIPDPSGYDFLPLRPVLGKPAIDRLFQLNLKWQKEIFESILESALENNDIKNSTDFFIFTPGTGPLPYMSIKKYIQNEFLNCKIQLKTKIPTAGKTRQNPVLAGLPGSTNSTAETMKCIFNELSKKYNTATVWNLESPALEPEHFKTVIRKLAQPGVRLTISSPQNRLVLFGCSSKNDDSNRETETVEMKIPALYDMASIQNIICYFDSHKSSLSKKRADELAATMKSIRQSLL